MWGGNDPVGNQQAIEFIRDDELVMVQESEDLAQVEALHLDRSGTYKTK